MRSCPAHLPQASSDTSRRNQHMGWSYDDDIELDYHVRRSALPAPGRVRDLLELTSRLHGSLLDRHRPLWEAHLIEGLRDGRFAMYIKLHHALVDGISGLRLVQRSLNTDPHDTRIPCMVVTSPCTSRQSEPHTRLARLHAGGGIPCQAWSLNDVTGPRCPDRTAAHTSVSAPRTMFNVPIGGARRCAAQSWSLERVKNVKSAAGVSVNDVVLAMCAGALRAYLLDHSELPSRHLSRWSR